jgi:hypothetical protein
LKTYDSTGVSAAEYFEMMNEDQTAAELFFSSIVIELFGTTYRELQSCPNQHEALGRAFEEVFHRIDFKNYRVEASCDGAYKINLDGVMFTVIAIAFGIFLGSKGVPLGDALRAVRSDH